MSEHYIFKSERLGFRNWTDTDIPKMSGINADPAVMEFFPSVQTTEQTAAFVTRMQHQFAEKGFCYFAVDRLDHNEFIGFIGLSQQVFESPFTPCIDIGWRLAQSAWNKGFATEGAKRCLDFAFNTIGLTKVLSMCPVVNARSEAVMKKIGMKRSGTFIHPLLEANERLKNCVAYEAEHR